VNKGKCLLACLAVSTQGGTTCYYLLSELQCCRGRVHSSRRSDLPEQTAEQPCHGGVMQQQSGLASPQQGLHELKGTGVKGRKGSKQHQIGCCRRRHLPCSITSCVESHIVSDRSVKSSKQASPDWHILKVWRVCGVGGQSACSATCHETTRG